MSHSASSPLSSPPPENTASSPPTLTYDEQIVELKKDPHKRQWLETHGKKYPIFRSAKEYQQAVLVTGRIAYFHHAFAKIDGEFFQRLFDNLGAQIVRPPEEGSKDLMAVKVACGKADCTGCEKAWSPTTITLDLSEVECHRASVRGLPTCFNACPTLAPDGRVKLPRCAFCGNHTTRPCPMMNALINLDTKKVELEVKVPKASKKAEEGTKETQAASKIPRCKVEQAGSKRKLVEVSEDDASKRTRTIAPAALGQAVTTQGPEPNLSSSSSRSGGAEANASGSNASSATRGFTQSTNASTAMDASTEGPGSSSTAQYREWLDQKQAEISVQLELLQGHEDAKNTIEKLKKEINACRHEVNTLQIGKKDLAERLNAAETNRKAAKSKLERLEKEALDRERSLKDYQTKVKSSEEHMGKLREENGSLRERNTSLTIHHDQSKTELRLAKDRFSRIEADFVKQQQEYKVDLEKQCQEKLKAKAEAHEKAKKATASRHFKDLRAAKDSATKSIQSAAEDKEETKRTKAKLEQMEKDLDSVTAENARLQLESRVTM